MKMALDPALSEALQQASQEAGQSKAVANRLLAWFTRLSDEEMTRETNAQFYNQVRSELKLDGAGDAD